MGHPVHPALRNERRGSYRTFIARAPSRARTRAGFACGFSGVYLQEARVGALVKSRRLRGEGFATGGEMQWRRRFESRAEEPLAAYGQIPPSALAASRDCGFRRPGAAGTGVSGLDVSAVSFGERPVADGPFDTESIEDAVLRRDVHDGVSARVPAALLPGAEG
jgi:hypothetical protein